ncbi:MAG: hypothetical protein ACOYL5_19160 [Phototrophicaceae bacterium]|jgi:hypothetical protein
MIGKNEISRQALIRAELNVLSWQTLGDVKRGDTIQMKGPYETLMQNLQARAQELTQQGRPHPQKVNDWLALALFCEDRILFLDLCEAAQREEDPIFRQAEHWLQKIISADREQLA